MCQMRCLPIRFLVPLAVRSRFPSRICRARCAISRPGEERIALPWWARTRKETRRPAVIGMVGRQTESNKTPTRRSSNSIRARPKSAMCVSVSWPFVSRRIVHRDASVAEHGTKVVHAGFVHVPLLSCTLALHYHDQVTASSLESYREVTVCGYL